MDLVAQIVGGSLLGVNTLLLLKLSFRAGRLVQRLETVESVVRSLACVHSGQIPKAECAVDSGAVD